MLNQKWINLKKTYNPFAFVNLPIYNVRLSDIDACIEECAETNRVRIDEFIWRIDEVKNWFVDGKNSKQRQDAYNFYYINKLGCHWAWKTKENPNGTSPIANRIQSLYWRAKAIKCNPLIKWCEDCIEAFRKDDPSQVENFH